MPDGTSLSPSIIEQMKTARTPSGLRAVLMERILPDARKSRRPISVSVFAIVSPLDRPQHNTLDEEALKERIKAKDWPGGNNDERVFHRFGHQKRRHAAVAACAALLAVVVGAEKAAHADSGEARRGRNAAGA